MGVYIGYIDQKESTVSTFYNFKPMAELKGTEIIPLSRDDQITMLPESDKLNINFSYNWRDDQQWMEDTFAENSLVIFEFTFDDLEDNFSKTGERNPTGYRVQTRRLWNSGKIRPIDQDHVYYVLTKENLQSDFTKDNIVEIEAPFITESSWVFYQDDNLFAGPYKVFCRTSRLRSYYITPRIKENKYTISGYLLEDINTITLDDSDDSRSEVIWPIACPKEDAKKQQRDVIEPQQLLESFYESLHDSDIKNGAVQLNDIPNFLERYNQSTLSGSVLSEKIRQNRLDSLLTMLTADRDVDYTLNEIKDSIFDLLIRSKDDPKVNEWLENLFDEHPEWFDQIKEMQTISNQIDLKKQDLDDLINEVEEQKKQLEEATQQRDTIYHEAIENQKNEIREMDEEYQLAKKQLADIQSRLQIFNDLDEASEKYAKVREEVENLQIHKSYVEEETKDIELEFQRLINKQHENMVNIAFDGFMSSKMLNAAAGWEAEDLSKQHEELVCKVNNIDAPDMTPDNLIEYLCNTIQILRPTYSKNTIINIMICISQGFLTVFAGEPGCGKTSICNIVGEVLGLNRISEEMDAPEEWIEEVNRYVPVSVERGWTSKRDFIGYYNPLSKVFDKSNKRVYEALYQLDTEKQKGFSKFPYIILLDESNLSPMEYYWSDFMNICDDLGPQSKVNLGENYLFGIPETLHFVATINNDHTTETLSPRLIDRAWIVALPEQDRNIVAEQNYEKEQIRIVNWDSIKATFIPTQEECMLTADMQKVYDNLITHLRKEHFTVSPRIEIAIKRYWSVASKLFEEDEMGTNAATIALDYAVAQKILPKIAGSGDEFEEWLEEFRVLCNNNDLNESARILGEIKERGNQQMKYYQFFA